MSQIARQIALPATYKPNDTLSDDLRDLGVDSAIVHKDDEGQEQTIYLDRLPLEINDGHMFNGYLNLDCGPQPKFSVKGINVAYYDANGANVVDKEIIIRNHILEHAKQDTFQVAVDHRVILPEYLLCNREQNILNDQKYYFILSSWADGGNLCDSLDPFNENHCRNKFRQVFEIVNYLHGHGIFHRDLKPENFVLHGEDDDVYMIDFGKSRICDTDLIENDNERYGTVSIHIM
jgi:serine/threonine protein kinase